MTPSKVILGAHLAQLLQLFWNDMTPEIKELLELAAKACGYVVKSQFDGSTACWVYRKNGQINVHGEPDIFKWDPLGDDGDNSRMEGALSIDIAWSQGQRVYAALDQRFGANSAVEFADHGGDKQSARRLASLIVAAEIGGQME